MDRHRVIPAGITAALAAPRLPLEISLHGSDVYVGQRLSPARGAARRAFARAGYVTACSDDLARRAVAIGAAPDRMETVPYGVDTSRFGPNVEARSARRRELGIDSATPLCFAAGRLVHKKGFEYLIDAVADVPGLVLAIAADGPRNEALHARAASRGVADRVRFLGDHLQDRVGELFAAADIIWAP